MAPARMISFMEKHVADCPVCQNDPDIHDEIAKIAEIILPESKIPKAVRMQNESADDDDDEDDEELDDESDDDTGDEEEDEDVYDDDEDDFEEEPDLEDE